jgi:hypothetical protein
VRVRALPLVLLLAAAGCATLDYEAPDSGPGATAQLTFALAVERTLDRTDFTFASGRRVYVAGWADVFGPPGAALRGRARSGEAARRADATFIADRVAARILAAHGAASSERDAVDVWIIPWVQVAGGETTHREYRLYGYPIYVDEEDYRAVWLELLLYEPASGRLTDLFGGRSYGLRFESYVLDIFGVRFGF